MNETKYLNIHLIKHNDNDKIIAGITLLLFFVIGIVIFRIYKNNFVKFITYLPWIIITLFFLFIIIAIVFSYKFKFYDHYLILNDKGLFYYCNQKIKLEINYDEIREIKDSKKVLGFGSPGIILPAFGTTYKHNFIITTSGNKEYRISNFTLDFLKDLNFKLNKHNIMIKNFNYIDFNPGNI